MSKKIKIINILCKLIPVSLVSKSHVEPKASTPFHKAAVIFNKKKQKKTFNKILGTA